MYSCSLVENDLRGQQKQKCVSIISKSHFYFGYASENGLTAVKSVIASSFTTIGKFIISLNLSSNSLASLPAGLFRGLHKLIDILLGHNSLESLPAGLFHGLLTCTFLGLITIPWCHCQQDYSMVWHKLA